VWLYQGGGLLQFDEFKLSDQATGSDQHSTTTVEPAGAAERLKRAPKKVWNRLPDSFKPPRGK
jgi:hypothetical protein